MRPRALLALVPLAALVAALASGAGAAHRALASGVVNVTTQLGYHYGATAAGTGMVLTPSGEILTNNHVIRGATSIKVTVPATGRSYTATVAGYSVGSDVAVLRLKGASGLTTVTLGHSAGVRVGDPVTGVGNAGGTGGLPKTAAGHVTALGQSAEVADEGGRVTELKGLIETDARLVPGDSGGPLLDASGEVIGIDTAASPTNRFSGADAVGLAVPIDHALAVVRQIESGTASASVHVGGTAFLGVSVGPPDSSFGALVVNVVPGSPADGAGLSPGSVIVALNGKRIATYDTLSQLMLRQTPGSVARLTWVDEGGTAHTAKVKTAAGPAQ